jgi:hypothetical protein
MPRSVGSPMIAGVRFLFTTLVSLFLVAACNGGGGEGVAAVPEGDLIGKWVLRKYHSEGYYRLLGGASVSLDEDSAFTDDRAYLQFKADSTFVSDLPDPESDQGTVVEVGTWRLSGNKVTTIASVDGVGQPDTLTWNVSIQGAAGAFSQHIDEKDALIEIKQDVLINAVKK